MKIEKYAIEFERKRENDDFKNSKIEENTKSSFAR
jgi:cell division protein FtsL